MMLVPAELDELPKPAAVSVEPVACAGMPCTCSRAAVCVAQRCCPCLLLAVVVSLTVGCGRIERVAVCGAQRDTPFVGPSVGLFAASAQPAASARAGSDALLYGDALTLISHVTCEYDTFAHMR